MRIIKPSYKIITKIDNSILKTIELAGRLCYKSEDKITDDSYIEFIKMLINKGHHSVLEHSSISVIFICDRGVSYELVRHRLCAFSQESTRYCNYNTDKFNKNITFIDIGSFIKDGHNYNIWQSAIIDAEIHYHDLIRSGEKPQIARAVLPNSLKTEIMVTTNIREWRHIFKLRTDETAHPQMRELMIPLYEELSHKLYPAFENL